MCGRDDVGLIGKREDVLFQFIEGQFRLHR
jgi:hypothetical protein